MESKDFFASKFERRKPKTPQKQNLTEVDGRDMFQTPNYAVDLLIPFMREVGIGYVWECAAGLGKIVNRLESHGFNCIASDLQDQDDPLNFLSDNVLFTFDAIVTNPPFSLKRKFFEKCIFYSKPFALLIPADYSGWIVDAVKTWGCEKIIPSRRIDYITPDILTRIHEGEIWVNSKEFYPDFGGNLKKFKKEFPVAWQKELDTYPGHCMWDSIYDAPAKLLKKYSASQFHSMWLTWGFNIGRTETFVELSNEDKFNI